MDSSFFKLKIVLNQWAKKSVRFNLEQKYQAREQNLVFLLLLLLLFVCLDSSQSSWFISSGLVRVTKSLSVTCYSIQIVNGSSSLKCFVL